MKAAPRLNGKERKLAKEAVGQTQRLPDDKAEASVNNSAFTASEMLRQAEVVAEATKAHARVPQKVI